MWLIRHNNLHMLKRRTTHERAQPERNIKLKFLECLLCGRFFYINVVQSEWQSSIHSLESLSPPSSTEINGRKKESILWAEIYLLFPSHSDQLFTSFSSIQLLSATGIDHHPFNILHINNLFYKTFVCCSGAPYSNQQSLPAPPPHINQNNISN